VIGLMTPPQVADIKRGDRPDEVSGL